MSVVVPRAAKVAGAAAGFEELAVASVAALSGEGVSLVVVPAVTVAGLVKLLEVFTQEEGQIRPFYT